MCDDSHPADDLKTEQQRLQTFRCWPRSAAVSPAPLARAGFYYLGQADRVRCVFCAGTLNNWQQGDDPATEHRTHFVRCPFMQGLEVGNVPLVSQPTNNTGGGSSPAGLDIGPEGPPTASNVLSSSIHPEYQSPESRRSSYRDWPPDRAPRPEVLVSAGLFYTGHGDVVRCFCCDGSLRSWERGDDPWVEHASWFPRCTYLLQQKGPAFIADVQARHQALQGQRRLSQEITPLPRPQGRPEHGEHVHGPGVQAVVREVLAMGFDPDIIQRALRKLLSSSSGSRLQDLNKEAAVQRLVDAVMDESEPQHSPGEGTHPLVTHAPSADLSPSTGTGAVAGQGGESSGAGSGDSDRTLCKICLDREVAVTFLPCGHLVCCAQCARTLQQCPVCRQPVRASIRTYLC